MKRHTSPSNVSASNISSQLRSLPPFQGCFSTWSPATGALRATRRRRRPRWRRKYNQQPSYQRRISCFSSPVWVVSSASGFCWIYSWGHPFRAASLFLLPSTRLKSALLTLWVHAVSSGPAMKASASLHHHPLTNATQCYNRCSTYFDTAVLRCVDRPTAAIPSLKPDWHPDLLRCRSSNANEAIGSSSSSRSVRFREIDAESGSPHAHPQNATSQTPPPRLLHQWLFQITKASQTPTLNRSSSASRFPDRLVSDVVGVEIQSNWLLETIGLRNISKKATGTRFSWVMEMKLNHLLTRKKSTW
jgi:hypothetical protein